MTRSPQPVQVALRARKTRDCSWLIEQWRDGPTDRLWPPRIALAIVSDARMVESADDGEMGRAAGCTPWMAQALVHHRTHRSLHLMIVSWRRIGGPVVVGRSVSIALLVSGGAVLVNSLLSRLPPSTWLQIPFRDDWTPLFQHAVSGVELMRRGVVVGWNWWFLGGYPTSTDIAQNLRLWRSFR